MNQSGGHAGTFSDAQDRGIGETLLMDNSDRSLYQLLAPDRTHSQLRHNPSRKKRRFSLVVRPRKSCGPVLLWPRLLQLPGSDNKDSRENMGEVNEVDHDQESGGRGDYWVGNGGIRTSG
jgi:hypothetical protein